MFSISRSSETVSQLYEEGVILDLTEYVEKYMPNYLAWIEEHPEYAKQVTNDGKYLTLYSFGDGVAEAFWGLIYRRDWLVKYGTNPETGEAFSGGWKDAEKTDWEDDVVFPSGNADPIYISDWEWMFEIFEKALEGEGITDGYVFQNYYTGYELMGDINTGFGGGNPEFYLDGEEIKFGGDSDNFRAFVECARSWYEKGWMNQNFEENSSDTLMSKVDSPSVFSGKVGLWYGYTNQIGNALDTGEGYTKDICVYGARQPINDVYGSKEQQGKTPDSFFQSSLVSKGVCVNSKTDPEVLPVLLTAVDWLYSREGGLLRSFGFSDEQMKELQDPFYLEYGMDHGVYTITEEDGVEIVHVDRNRDSQDGLGPALANLRVPGLSIQANLDQGYSPVQAHGYGEVMTYEATANIGDLITGRLTAEQSQEISTIRSNIRTYMAQAIPNFITGRADIEDDAAWQEYCDTVNSYGVETYESYLNDAMSH